MSPVLYRAEEEDVMGLTRRLIEDESQISKPQDPDELILESWAQGFMVGSLIIMACVTIANMRRGVLLHKLILIELIFGVWHGFFIFFNQPIYGWWLSISAIFLNASWSLHNVIAWIKNKPFLSRRVSFIYIGTVILAQSYWVLEIYANFTYFHNVNTIFLKTRPLEALFRDPWWIFTTVSLFYNITNRYEMSLSQIVRLSPRFSVMLGAMVLSICFLVVDICSVTGALSSTLPVGINPFWKLSFVFKCLTDSLVLDDFKTALDRLHAFQITRLGSFAIENSPIHALDQVHGCAGQRSTRREESPSPNGDELSRPGPWSNSPPPVYHVDMPKAGDQEISPSTKNSSDLGVARVISDSTILPSENSSDLGVARVTSDSSTLPSENSSDLGVARVTSDSSIIRSEPARSSRCDSAHAERAVTVGRSW